MVMAGLPFSGTTHRSVFRLVTGGARLQTDLHAAQLIFGFGCTAPPFRAMIDAPERA